MTDKKSIAQELEDKIKDAAKAVEDFADKVAAPEEPLVIIPDPEDTTPGSKDSSKP